MTDTVRVLQRRDFQRLLDALQRGGYRTVGPTVRDGAIVYAEILSASDLPEGWTDRQDGGTYRLTVRVAGGSDVPLPEVTMVKRRRHGILLGALIGAGVGTAFAIPLNMRYASEGGDSTGATVTLLALSTGIGIGVDALIDLPQTVYRRGDRLRF